MDSSIKGGIDNMSLEIKKKLEEIESEKKQENYGSRLVEMREAFFDAQVEGNDSILKGKKNDDELDNSDNMSFYTDELKGKVESASFSSIGIHEYLELLRLVCQKVDALKCKSQTKTGLILEIRGLLGQHGKGLKNISMIDKEQSKFIASASDQSKALLAEVLIEMSETMSLDEKQMEVIETLLAYLLRDPKRPVYDELTCRPRREDELPHPKYKKPSHRDVETSTSSDGKKHDFGDLTLRVRGKDERPNPKYRKPSDRGVKKPTSSDDKSTTNTQEIDEREL